MAAASEEPVACFYVPYWPVNLLKVPSVLKKCQHADNRKPEAKLSVSSQLSWAARRVPLVVGAPANRPRNVGGRTQSTAASPSQPSATAGSPAAIVATSLHPVVVKSRAAPECRMPRGATVNPATIDA